MKVAWVLHMVLLSVVKNSEPATALELVTAFRNLLAFMTSKTSNTDCKITDFGLAPKDERELLKRHNDFRSEIATGKVENFPKAADMNMLEWDVDLATEAQQTARSCDPSKQDGCIAYYADGDATKDITQNTGSHTVKVADPSSQKGMAVLENWIKAKKEFDVPTLEKYAKPTDADAERFSQVIWAKTLRIGCGYVHFSRRSQPSDYPTEILVCNYSPGGRKDGQPVYQKGEPCAKCEEGKVCDDTTQLCVIGPLTRTEEGDVPFLAVAGVIAAIIAVGVIMAALVSMQSAGSDAPAGTHMAAVPGTAAAAQPERALAEADGAKLGDGAPLGDEVPLVEGAPLAESAPLGGGAGDQGGEEIDQENSKEAEKSDAFEKSGSEEAIIEADE